MAERAREPQLAKLPRDLGKQPGAGGEEGKRECAASARGETGCRGARSPPCSPRQCSRHPIPARPRSKPSAFRAPSRFPDPLVEPEPEPSWLRVKAPAAGSRRGRPAPELLGARASLQITEITAALQSHRDRSPGFQSPGCGLSGMGMRAIRTLECGESTTLPSRRNTASRLRGRVQGLCAPDFIQCSAPRLQAGGGSSLYRRKTRFKHTLALWFLYGRPSVHSRLPR